jgi:hypothetical protein
MQEKEVIVRYYLDHVDRLGAECIHLDAVSCTYRWRCLIEKRWITAKAILTEGGLRVTRLE